MLTRAALGYLCACKQLEACGNTVWGTAKGEQESRYQDKDSQTQSDLDTKMREPGKIKRPDEKSRIPCLIVQAGLL